MSTKGVSHSDSGGAGRGQSGENKTCLFPVSSLFGYELVEHGPKLLVDLLHLVDVTGHFVHGLHRHWKGK